MGQATDGLLPQDALGYRAEGVYVPGIGTVAQQGTNVGTDALGTNYAATAVTTTAGSATSLSAANTGIAATLPAIVQKASAVSTGSVATLAKAFTSNNTAGNSIVVVAGCGNGTAMTVADSLGNTYTSAIAAPNSTTFEAQIFYAVNILGGVNTVTVTNAGSAASMAVQLYEVNGLIAQVANVLDQTSSGTGTGTTASASNIASVSPNALAFAGVAVGTAAQAVTASVGTFWTLDSSQNSAGTPAGLFTFGALSQALGSVTSVAAKATIASSEPWAYAVATFKPVTLGVQGTVSIGGYNYTNMTTQTTTQIKTGPGVLHAIVVNKPVAAGVIELDDALSHVAPVIGTITVPATATNPFTATYDIAFATGLSITTSGATQDITVVWK
ncbi:MAG: hypothetical protein H0W02_10115 [Ktedonobacteraceae bacterium]|nr:hypothetical protein [Ktedonobacteraceae bacterium]